MKASQPVASIESLALAPPPPTAGGGLADAGDEGGESRPVTVVVTREVRPGRQADYEAWLADLIEEASRLEGYLGTEVHRPGPGERT